MSAPAAAALDLGSTRLKLATLRADGILRAVASEPFPLLAGGGMRYEIDAQELLRLATSLLQRVPRATPIGIASQRSSFVLWDRRSGEPVCEAISWRDRRAEDWCREHRALESNIEALTGLRLSPHYAGPKLAALFEQRPELRERAQRSQILFGTLETFLLWHWSSGKVHATDATMAARTLLADPRNARWSKLSLEAFGVPVAMLPRIETTAGRAHEVAGGRRVVASIADQPSGLLAVARAEDVLVNLGTGAFVLRGLGLFEPQRGYLCGPTLWRREGARYALEGTINGGGSTLERFGAGEVALGPSDPEPGLFASPDESGLGAPRWIATAGVRFSREDAPPLAKKRAWFEGLVFRIREILEDIAPPRARVMVSGGLAREPYLAAALATSVDHPIELLAEHEATLLGAARLAAGLDPYASIASTRVEPEARATWLRDKYERWREWMAAVKW